MRSKIKIIRNIILIFLIIGVNTHCLSNIYFVSNTEGSDLFVGNLKNPFKTIQYGIEKMNEGDSLFLREG